jgi:hypothetical protein
VLHRVGDAEQSCNKIVVQHSLFSEANGVPVTLFAVCLPACLSVYVPVYLPACLPACRSCFNHADVIVHTSSLILIMLISSWSSSSC